MRNPLLDLTGDFLIAEKDVAVSTSSVPAVGQDVTRWAIIFAQPATANTIWVTTLGVAVNARGLPLPPNFGPVYLDFRTFGALTQQAWAAIASAVSQHLTVIEIMYRPVGWEEAGPELLDELAERYRSAGL